MSRRTSLSLGLITAALLAPAAADAAPGPASVGLHVGHLRGGKAQILSKVPIKGTLSPYVAGEKVDLLFFRNGHQVGTETVAVHDGPGGKGTFKSKFRVRRSGRFAVQAVHQATALAGAEPGKADAELAALARSALLGGARLVHGLHREAAVATDPEVGLERALAAGAVVDLDRLGADLMPVAEEE